MATDTSTASRPAPDSIAGHSRPPRRVARVLVGVALIVVSVGMIAAGALAAMTRFGGTYVDLGGHGSYRTDRYGIATASTNWRNQFLGWTGAVRLEVAPADHKPIFVGVAGQEAIGRYLAGTGYTTVEERAGADVVRTDHDGAAPAMPAATAAGWTVHAEGAGTQTLRWQATDGPQVVFAMNADGTRPVGVRVLSSAVTLDRMPWWLPAGSLAVGAILLYTGFVMLRSAIGARRGIA